MIYRVARDCTKSDSQKGIDRVAEEVHRVAAGLTFTDKGESPVWANFLTIYGPNIKRKDQS